MEAGSGVFTPRFSEYFAREVAQKAASSLSNGIEIEFQVEGESFTFTKAGGKNQIRPGAALSPQMIFIVPAKAAETILSDPSDEVAGIGIGILKLVASSDANARISVKFKAGFMTLFTKGYFGVLTAGGAQFASHLASRGLNGMGAIKAVLKKVKE